MVVALLLFEEVPFAAVEAAGKPVKVPVVLLADIPPNTSVLLEDTVGAWTGLLSRGVEVVGVTAKMGLNPEASRGLLLPTGADAGLELGAVEALGVVAGLAIPNRLAADGAPAGALETCASA